MPITMKRIMAASSIVIVLLAVPTAAHAGWNATKTVADAVSPAGITFKSPIYNTFRGRDRGTVSSPGILSYADLDMFQVDAPNIAPGTRVLYDMESWVFTPIDQQNHPYRSERSFVAIAHQAGLVAGLCPSRKFLPLGKFPKGATISADFFIIQGLVTQSTGRVMYDYLHMILKQQSGRVWVKLSAVPRHSLDFLLSQWRTARKLTPRFVLWGARDTASIQVAVSLLQRVGV